MPNHGSAEGHVKGRRQTLLNCKCGAMQRYVIGEGNVPLQKTVRLEQIGTRLNLLIGQGNLLLRKSGVTRTNWNLVDSTSASLHGVREQKQEPGA